MTLKIKNGWVVGVERKTTKKQGGAMRPIGVVFHYTAGWTTNGDVATLSTSDRKASVQFVLGRDGRLVQIVSCDRVGWHAGPSKYKGMTGLNSNFIGIEICNAGWIKHLSNGNFIDQYSQQIRPGGQFVGQDRHTHSAPKDWPVHHHPRLAKGTYRWEPYYPPQLDVLDDLVMAILKAYPSVKHFVTHEEIDTRGWKTDPGPMFDMRRYLRMLEDRGKDEPDDDVVQAPAPVQVAPAPAPAPVQIEPIAPLSDAVFTPASAPAEYDAPVRKFVVPEKHMSLLGPQEVVMPFGHMVVWSEPMLVSRGHFNNGDIVHISAIDGPWVFVYSLDKRDLVGWVMAANLRPMRD